MKGRSNMLGADVSIRSIKSKNSFLILIFLLFFFGCIELKPREGFSSEVKVEITEGTDICAGFTEPSCGAFLKEKRTAVSNFVCKGPIGPASQKLSNYTYSFDSSRGWNCEKLDSSKSFSFYLSRVSSAPYSISTHCNGYKNWIGKCKQSGPCPVSRKGPLIFTIDRNLKASVDFLEGIDYILANCVGTISGGINGRLDHDIVLMCGAGSVLDSFSLPSLTTTGRCGGVRTPQSDSFKCKYTPYTGNQPYTLSVQTILTEKLNECGSGDCGGWDIGITYQFYCDIFANYNVNYVCKNSYTGEEYLYVNCSYDKFSTFQGGKTYLDNNTPYSKLSSYLQSYYGTYSYNPVTGETQPAGTIQVPFFMLGQGPSFQDYEEAKKLCVPWKETIVNVSLGNTTFDPPFLTIPSGMELCIENKDKNKHELDVTDLADQEIVRSIVLQPKQAHCYIPSSGFYHVKDSNGDYAYLSVIKSSNTANIYVGQNIVPNYSVVTDGGIVNITLIERKEHNLTIKSINRFDDFKYEENITLNLSNSVKTFQAPKPGEYQIDDNSTGKKGYLFVQSPLFRFLFRSDGSVDPNYEIYRPIGDLICFRSEVPNLNISVYRYTETEQGYEWIWLTNESISTSSYCCIQGTLPGKYYGITSDGRIVNWTIGTGKPSATISIQQIGFEPEELESTPGTKICWINPSAISRQIITKSSTTGKAFFSGKIPPLSDNVCWPTMNKTDSFVTRFVPDIGPKNIINIKEIETKNIQILPGGGGFDTISAVVKPGSQVCWINNDNKNHTLKDEKGNYLLLEPSQTNCIVKENMKEGDLYTRQLDDKAIYSDVAVIDGTGAILSSRGPVPISLFVQLPETNMSSDGSLIITKPS
ncbi:MAG: hypothetical protein NZ903_00975, partial [Candidatus Micrarchaeota archaeon]|nr:hypothetical protein [Candidatus Micrarchaeota archaeon]